MANFQFHPLSIALLAVAALTMFSVSPASAQDALTGPAQIIDGDTILISGRVVRLRSLDAPEPGQTCNAPATARCGELAALNLAGIIESQWLTCTVGAAIAADPVFATCRAGGPKGIDIGAQLVNAGWALAVPGDATYAAQHDAARAGQRGLWQGAFITPWQWRAGLR